MAPNLRKGQSTYLEYPYLLLEGAIGACNQVRVVFDGFFSVERGGSRR